jgi:phage gp45-like
MRLISKMIRPLKNRITLMVSRAVLLMVDDEKTL